MKKFIVGLASAIGAFVAVRKLSKQEQSSFEWIDADDDEDVADELIPEYEVGEIVVTYNPYIEDYADFDFDGSPVYYEIEEVKWDETDKCFRYKVEDGRTWLAESWLAYPKYPFMEKDMGEFKPETNENKGEAVPMKINNGKPTGHRASEKTEVARRKAWSKRADELLDLYNGHKSKGNLETAERIMEQYKYEQAMFNAGTLIREMGGELGGERPEPKFEVEEDDA